MGNALRFHDVYEENVGFVWRYVSSMGVPRDQVADIAQEIFLIVHQKLSTFEERSTVRTWIAGISVNVVRSYRRRRTTGTLGTELVESSEPSLIAGPVADRLLDAKEEATLVLAALDAMTELQREAFSLVELLETSAVEAARILEVNENTLRARLRAARTFFNAVASAHREGLRPNDAVRRALDRSNP